MPTTTTTTDHRRRLAELMDARRLELELNWRQVAEASGFSYEAVRSARVGRNTIRDLTQQGIEDALRWQRGSIRAILGGGDPVTIDPPPAEGTPAVIRDLPGPLTDDEQEAAAAAVRSLRAERDKSPGIPPELLAAMESSGRTGTEIVALNVEGREINVVLPPGTSAADAAKLWDQIRQLAAQPIPDTAPGPAEPAVPPGRIAEHRRRRGA